MTSQNDRAHIERLLMDAKRKLNEAADAGDIKEMGRLTDQCVSLSRLLEVAS